MHRNFTTALLYATSVLKIATLVTIDKAFTKALLDRIHKDKNTSDDLIQKSVALLDTYFK